MNLCPYCGYSNSQSATECRKCQASLVRQTVTLHKSYWLGPEKARVLRDRALSVVILGLLIKVYWGGHGPWPVIDYPPWADLRPWLEPLFLYGGVALYIAGWVLKYI